MYTDKDSNVIDEKKAEESGKSASSPDFKAFIINYLISIIITIGISIFVIGGLGLYTSKVAQSNILPDNIDLAPYTIFDRIVEDNFEVDINIMRPSFFSDNNKTVSQKAIFNSQEYLDSFNNSFLCYQKQNAIPKYGYLGNINLYFSSVYDNIRANNFLAINTIFLYLSYLPESIIMLLYGFFGIFLWIGLYFFNLCISIFYHIINIPQLFRVVSENENQWENNENISFFRFNKLIFFGFMVIVGFFSTFLMPIFFTLYGLISPLFATYKIKEIEDNKVFNVFNFLYNNFTYKTFFFFILSTISLFLNGTKYLGNNAIIGIIVAVVFAYIMGLYNNIIPEIGTNGFSLKIKQNISQANVAKINSNKPKLVKICPQIPVNDKKMQELISRGIERKSTISNRNNVDLASSNLPPNQTGGEKNYLKNNKKYNIKWT